MALENKTLEQILAEGTITVVYIGGTDQTNLVLTQGEIDGKDDQVKAYIDNLFGSWAFNTNALEYDGTEVLKASATSVNIASGLDAAFIESTETEITSTTVNLTGLTIANIDSGDSQGAVTKEWVEAKIAAIP